MTERHVLGISGGRDSAALAVYMRQQHPELDIEYFFTDTGKELPEVYEFLGRLEGFLGKPIARLNPERDFDFWLKEYKDFLPSPQTRWCTKQLKIKPFETWVKTSVQRGDQVHSYVAIRSDEDYREGYVSGQSNLKVHLPFREAGIDKAGVTELLEAAGVGLPSYYRWRSRSGCTFCFYQQKIEWARLLDEHPDAFEDAKRYEKNALDHGSPFTWSQGESLEDLSRPERLAQIRIDHDRRVERLKRKRLINALQDEAIEIDEVYGSAGKMCVTCHK
ncbi:phosphoadenosine phosphosulfate reductase family protein [Caulobacter sp. UNC358MFTsu5.1]|uniref:phosphoadenosine phosphosulfate reductase family protein n=1 Tax=Caulobacter sp. UNC358MFTsu5.1 TaxID=1449049 RepID=UPI0004A719A5|nr:phosphoadenosine phosphosulfate reductase family protein [Caulobacter sp. UNC358MFTsu5.1]